MAVSENASLLNARLYCQRTNRCFQLRTRRFLIWDTWLKIHESQAIVVFLKWDEKKRGRETLFTNYSKKTGKTLGVELRYWKPVLGDARHNGFWVSLSESLLKEIRFLLSNRWDPETWKALNHATRPGGFLWAGNSDGAAYSGRGPTP